MDLSSVSRTIIETLADSVCYAGENTLVPEISRVVSGPDKAGHQWIVLSPVDAGDPIFLFPE